MGEAKYISPQDVTVPAPVGGKPLTVGDWGLTAQQMQLAELMLLGPVDWKATAAAFHVTDRTLRNWRRRPEFQEYLRYLTDVAVSEVASRIKSRFAAEGPELAERILSIAKGQEKPASPYEDKFVSMVLNRLTPQPTGKAQELGVKNEPDGTVTIVWRARD